MNSFPNTQKMMELMRRLHPLHRTLLSDGTDQALEIIGEYLPGPGRYHILEYPSGQDVWTWTVPKRFVVQEAYLEVVIGDSAERIVDFVEDPIHLVSYSQPIEGEFTFDEIEPHLHYDEKHPNATPWVFKYYDSDWGFCLPFAKFKSLPQDGKFRAVIRTEFVDDFLRVGEYDIPGTSNEYLLFVAAVCHPSQVNDSISGAVVNVDLACHLFDKPPSYFGLKFLFLPETIGSISYLANNEHLIPSFRAGFFSEMIGHDNTIRLQRTRQDNDILDRIARHVIDGQTQGDFIEGPFCHTIITNDEKVTNAPGVDIPTIAINRWPYEDYHTTGDCPDAMVPENLAEVGIIYERIVDILQSNAYPRRRFRGPLFLSGLDLDLDWRSDRKLKRALQEIVLHLEGDKSAFDIAEKTELDYDIVVTFLRELHRQGFVEFAYGPWETDPTRRALGEQGRE